MKKPDLPKEEWNFSACPEAERAACHHYEYAREYVRTRPELTAKLMGEPRPSPYHNRLIFIYSKKRHPDSLPMICCEFPAVPWLKLPPETRRMLIIQCQSLPENDPRHSNLLVEDGFDVSLLRELDVIREKLFAQWMQENRDQHDRETSGLNIGMIIEEQSIERPALCAGPKRYYAVSDDVALAVIQLDWRQSDRRLKEAFQELLERRPKRPLGPEEGRRRSGGRGLASDQLNQLGAKRLLACFGAPEAALEAIEAVYATTRNKPPYSDADALRGAVAKADKALNDMECAGRFQAFADL